MGTSVCRREFRFDILSYRQTPMTFTNLSEAELAKEGIVKLCDFPYALWLTSPNRRSEIGSILKDVPNDVRKMRYSRRKSNKGRARTVDTGKTSQVTTSKPEGTERQDTAQRIGFECASPVIQTYIRSPSKNSSPSTRIPHCEHCGRVGLKRNGRWDFCPPCGLYQLIK